MQNNSMYYWVDALKYLALGVSLPLCFPMVAVHAFQMIL